MLDKNFIEGFAKRSGMPVIYPRRLLTEYLQAEILQILYGSKYGQNFAFLGGTCLRFVYKIERFSEDLDFDFIGEKELDYEELAKYLEKKLSELGFVVDMKVKRTENIFVIFIKFLEVMKKMGLSNLNDQKLKIKFEVDPEPLKNIVYQSEKVSSFGKSFNIIANDLPTLFAQKLLALFLRPYQKGRDFYDLIWFLGQRNLEPNYKILQEKGFEIGNKKELVKKMRAIISKLDLKQASKDVQPFLFYPQQAEWILDFEKYLDDYLRRP